MKTKLAPAALADGHPFTGWKHSRNWEIQDDAFARVRNGSQLVYAARPVPDNFELRFEWKVSQACNRDICYHLGQGGRVASHPRRRSHPPRRPLHFVESRTSRLVPPPPPARNPRCRKNHARPYLPSAARAPAALVKSTAPSKSP